MALMEVLPPVRVLFFLIVGVQLIESHHVPVFIWGSNSHGQLSSLSAQFKREMQPMKSSNSKCTLIMFIQDRLSLEDLSVHGNGLAPQGQNYNHLQSHLDKYPSVTLPSVEDPFQVIRDIKGCQTIRATDYSDDIRPLLSGSNSHCTVVYLPPTVGIDNRPEALKANDELMSKAVSHLGSKCCTAVFTGKEPSWDAASEEASHRRIARSLLAAAESNVTTFAIYADTVKVKIVDVNGIYNVTNATLEWPPTISTQTENSSLVTTWKFASTEIFPDFSLDFTFKKGPSYWKATDIVAKFTHEKAPSDPQTLKLKADNDITAGKGFSFSCTNTVLKGRTNYTLYVTLHNFQVEPFSTQNLTSKGFSDSFHCSTFFTLPIWMGFFTVLLFTVILGIGIFMLFQVKTTDRFDDPKGKTITVPQSE